jgi:ubiquitin-activating enzyme E1
LISDFAKFDRPATLHTAFQAIDAFKKETGRLPRPRNTADAVAVVKLAKKIATDAKQEGLNEDIVREVALEAEGELAPMIAVIGSFVAQEVLKACSGKFHPTVQHLYCDSLESLPSDAEKRLTETECAPSGTRYDRQIAVFGKTFQEQIANTRQFLVGAGAIGCEMLKNWALMGLGTGPKGKITVTDMDSIEKSNLNRQFLFRPKDVGKFKAQAAAEAVVEMNPALRGKIESLQLAVGEQTESSSSVDHRRGCIALTFGDRCIRR